ncbi:uncharacterized protein G2W53_027450 [Senna tora]|uniref:Retrotransposon gag domain-containing protein n=1 Tax=Senna tora TaxID=362788 RepID=A0A834TJC2_9FABA|nr:uncharacterized protein G2W53_027450 [Senna tora]
MPRGKKKRVIEISPPPVRGRKRRGRAISHSPVRSLTTPSSPESIHSEEAEMAEQNNRNESDYATSKLDGLQHSIRRPSIQVNNFEIKLATIQLLQANGQFGGSPVEDPNNHILNFLEFCDTFKHNGVSDDAIRLRLFPFSLRDKAKFWLQSLPEGSITTWEELAQQFLTKYFPPGKTAKMRNDITSFVLLNIESLYEAWERFKDLLRKCPHHGLPKWLQVQTFYNGLSSEIKTSIDAAAGRRPSLTWRGLLAGKQLIEKDLIWCIGDGRSTTVWGEAWIPGFPNFVLSLPLLQYVRPFGESSLTPVGRLNSEGGFPGVAPCSSGGPEVAPDEHAGLEAIVVETCSTLTSVNDLRYIWELFFASFEREILSALKTRNPDDSFSGFSFDFDIVLARPDECVLDGPPDSFAFYFRCAIAWGWNPPLKLFSITFKPLSRAWLASSISKLGAMKKIGKGSSKQNIARILATAKREEAERGQASSDMPFAGSSRVSGRSSKGKEAAVYKDPKSQGPLRPRKLVINEGGEKKWAREKSPEISSPAAKKSKTRYSSKTALVGLTQTLPSPPSVVPPGAEKETPLLSYDLAIDVRVGERSLAPVYPEHNDYLICMSDRSLYRSEYDAASLIRNRMSCSDDRSALEKLVREHGPWALRDLPGKEMVRMCSTYAAFVEIEEKMVGWYKDRLHEVSDAHKECLNLTQRLGDCEKAIDALTSERDKLKLEKETAMANIEVYRSKVSGFEL